MGFRLPNFNVACNVWNNGPTIPPAGPPTFTVNGNLSPGKLTISQKNAAGAFPQFTMLLRVPALTDLRGYNFATASVLECPAASGRFYQCWYVDDIAKGFPNEHRFCEMWQDPVTWPLPTP